MTNEKTLRDLRVSIGLSQRELADVMGICEKTVCNGEKDSRKLSQRTLDKFLYVFNVKHEDLYKGKLNKITEDRLTVVLERAKSIPQED